MTEAALTALLSSLIATWENEVVEFKQAGNDYDTDKIGRYFSAMSNEANLRSLDRAWLVFGVSNKTRGIINSDYRENPERLQSTKQQIAENTEPSITFRNIHELNHPDGRVVLFEIPTAPRGMPIAWKGHYYARSGESLGSLGLDKQDEIRQQTLASDWSAQVVPGASLNDLDEQALQKARESYAKKYSNRFPAEEVMRWPLETFLDRARLTQDGQITRTTLLLLGKPESAYLLSPHPAQMTWKLEGPERAYEHFGPPFLLNTSGLYQKIRKIYRIGVRLATLHINIVSGSFQPWQGNLVCIFPVRYTMLCCAEMTVSVFLMTMRIEATFRALLLRGLGGTVIGFMPTV